MKLWLGCFLAIFVIGSCNAWSETITTDGVTLPLSAPSNFCFLSNNFKYDQAAMVAQSRLQDSQFILFAMALPCEELARARKSGWGSEQSKLSGYAIWSVAGSGATPSRIPHTTREQFIAFIAQHMKTASIRWAEFDAKIAHLGIERVDSQDFGIIERDPEAVYTGAFVKFSAFDPMLVVGGTTVLNRYLVTVALYGAYNGHSSMQSALAQVKKSISASLEVDGAIVALLKGDQESWRTAIPQLRTVAITALIESVPPNNPPTSPLQVVACINALIAGQPVKGISETISREFIVGSVIHLVSACTAAQQ